MLIEYIGLPGSGKSSLEKAISQKLNSKDLQVISRNEAVDLLCASIFPISRGGNVIFRKISSGLYKVLLYVDTLLGLYTYTIPLDFFIPHRTRAAMRIAEDIRLYKFSSSEIFSKSYLLLSEGILHHLSALHFWRSPYNHEYYFRVPEEIKNLLTATKTVVVYIELSAENASLRLQRRGRPKFWPRHLETKVILNGFEKVISATLVGLEKDLEDKVLCLKGDHPDLTWQKEATYLLNALVQKKRKGI